MASSLFTLASRAIQAAASRRYDRSPIGQAASAVRNASRGQTAADVRRILGNQSSQRLIREVANGLAGASPERYSLRASTLLGQLLSSLGPIGEAIRLAVGGAGRHSLQGDQLESAIALIRALGGEYLTMDPSSPHYRRGIEAAKKVVSSGRESDPAVVMRMLEDVQRQIESGGGAGKPPGGKPPTTGDDDGWPEEHGITLIGRGSASYDREAMEAILAREIKTPDSSNVYSFVYEEETAPEGKFYQRSGILYVTFRPWYPGIKDRRPNSPGPMYAYYDVPLRRYKAFEAAAKNLSAGGAVWDYLRVRGSKWDHRFPYRIVAGTVVPAGGIYVPRKATQLGYKRRTLAHHGVGRRGFTRSQLPEQNFLPDRGWPNRGDPNRGEPNRGR